MKGEWGLVQESGTESTAVIRTATKMADDNINSLVDSFVRIIVSMDNQQGKILLKAFLT